MKYRRRKIASKGFTLIELLIVIVLGALMMAALVSLYSSGQRYFITESARSDLLRDGRSVLNWMSRDIKEAIQIVESWDVYSTSTNSLVLKVPSVDGDGLIIDIENDFDYIVYHLNSEYPTRLERIVEAKDGVSSRIESNRVLATRVNSFVLSSGGVELSSVSDLSEVSNIDIALVVRQTYFNRNFEETLNSLVRLRNKVISES